MKRTSLRSICLILVLVLIAACAMPAFAGEHKHRARGAYRVVVSEPRERLNVHETPKGGRENVIDRLKEGTVVMFLESEKGWWHIQWWKNHDDLREGFVDKSFLVSVDEDPSVLYTVVDNTYLHSTCDITEGDCSYYHIDKVKTGSKFTILEQKNTWSLIHYNDKDGWIPSKYLIQAK